MKCEKCNNEATFHYQININGEKTEHHLCAECSKEAGFGDMMGFSPRAMIDSFRFEPFGTLMNSFFDEPFGSWGRSILTPVMTIPQLRIMIEDPETTEDVKERTESTEKAKDNIPEDAGEEIRGKRKLFALKNQLKSAIRSENFEKAAELRDKIHKLEGK